MSDDGIDAITIAKRIVAEAAQPRRKPTIDELEAILARDDGPPVTLNADGSIGVGEDEKLILAQAVIALAAAKPAADVARAEQVRSEPLRTSEPPSSTGGRTELLPCPFCGQPPFRGRGKINPYAVCRTEDCFGAKVAAVSLDDPGDVAAYNRRALLSSDTGGRTEEVRAALEIAVDRFQDAVVDREHAQTAYRRSCQKEFEEAREALLTALSTKQRDGK